MAKEVALIFRPRRTGEVFLTDLAPSGMLKIKSCQSAVLQTHLAFALNFWTSANSRRTSQRNCTCLSGNIFLPIIFLACHSLTLRLPTELDYLAREKSDKKT